MKVADAIKVQFNRWWWRNRLPSVLKYGSEIWNVWIWLQAAGGRNIFWALIIEERAETQPAVLMEGPDDCTSLREQTHRGGERGAASWELINVRSMAWLLFTRAKIRDNVTIGINPQSATKNIHHTYSYAGVNSLNFHWISVQISSTCNLSSHKMHRNSAAP